MLVSTAMSIGDDSCLRSLPIIGLASGKGAQALGEGVEQLRSFVVSLSGVVGLADLSVPRQWSSDVEGRAVQAAAAITETNAEIARVLSATKTAADAVGALADMLTELTSFVAGVTAGLKEQVGRDAPVVMSHTGSQPPPSQDMTTTYATRTPTRLSPGWDVCS